MSASHNDLFRIERNSEIEVAGKGRSYAIIVPIVERQGSAHFLFEVRAFHLNTQPGEICLPGGAIEASDASSWIAAKRECMEELLIAPDDIIPIMRGDRFVTPFNQIIDPYIARLNYDAQQWSTAEVDTVFTVPIQWFLTHEPAVYYNDIQQIACADFPFHLLPNGKDYHWFTSQNELFFYEYEGRVIWGMTARLVRQAIHLLTQYRLIQSDGELLDIKNLLI